MQPALVHSLALLSLSGWVLVLRKTRPTPPRWLWACWALALGLNLHPWLVSLASEQELARLTPVPGQVLELDFRGARTVDWELGLRPVRGVPEAGDWPTRHLVRVGFNGRSQDPDAMVEDSRLRIRLSREEARLHNRISLEFHKDSQPGPVVITVSDLEYRDFGLGLVRGLLRVLFGHALVLVPLWALGWRRTQRL